MDTLFLFDKIIYMNNELEVVVNNDNTIVTVEQSIKAIKNAGFKNVFVQWYDKDYPISQLQQVNLCKELGLNIEFAHLGYQNINHIWLDDGEYFVDRYKKDILDCHNLGIDFVVMHACAKWDAPEINELGLNRFKQIVEYANTLGVKVAIENTKVTKHLDYLLENIDFDNLGVCFDAGHYHCNQKDKWDVTKHKDRIFCVHLHDNDGENDQHLLPFDGSIDWNKTFEILRDLNYYGPITMELCYRNEYEKISIDNYYAEGYKRGIELVKIRDEIMSDLKDEKLEEVSGGESTRRDKTIKIELQFQETSFEKKIVVYVDGQLNQTLCTTIDGMVTCKVFKFNGSGTKMVKFNVNGSIYKEFTVDFESGTYF